MLPEHPIGAKQLASVSAIPADIGMCSPQVLAIHRNQVHTV